MATLNRRSNLGGLALPDPARGSCRRGRASSTSTRRSATGLPFVSVPGPEKIVAPREGRGDRLPGLSVSPLFDLEVWTSTWSHGGWSDEKLTGTTRPPPLPARQPPGSGDVRPDQPPGPGRDQVPSGLTTTAVVVEDDSSHGFLEGGLTPRNEAFAKLLDSDLEKLDVEAAT